MTADTLPFHFNLRIGVALCIAMALPASALAFEADVHFGLTRWLALRAGFTEPQAEAIAIADQRVDGGLVESIELDLEYACAGHFPQVARQAQQEHYPSATSVPAPPADRVVQAGSAAAHRELDQVFAAAKGKEGLMLGKFGHALHPLQDSWSHQGTPSQKQPSQTLSSLSSPSSLSCDASLLSGHPLARGGPDSHAADLTMRWPADTLAMARATYDALLKWGDIEGQKRRPTPWDASVRAIEEFAKASTKTQKRAWFNAQGMSDTGFLEGISLPDGPSPGPLVWKGRRLPPLPSPASQQHDAPIDVRAFFDRFLSRWLSSEKVEALVTEMGRGRQTRDSDSPGAQRQLIARLKLWKLRDHGSAAELAHAHRTLRRGPVQSDRAPDARRIGVLAADIGGRCGSAASAVDPRADADAALHRARIAGCRGCASHDCDCQAEARSVRHGRLDRRAARSAMGAGRNGVDGGFVMHDRTRVAWILVGTISQSNGGLPS